MQLNRDSAMAKLAAMGMDDMPVIEYMPNRCMIDNDWFQKYSMLRREFLASLKSFVRRSIPFIKFDFFISSKNFL